MKAYAPLLTLALFLACGIARAEEPDAEGFIRDWLMLAPLQFPDTTTGPDEVDKSTLPDEGKLAPKAGDKAKFGDKELTWKKIKAKDYFFDVNDLLGDMFVNVASYFVVYVEAPDEIKDIKLQIGSNDEAKVYLNEKALITVTQGRTLDKDQDNAPATLKKGVNKVVFKVINDANNWQGCLRFTDKDGKPVKNLKLKFEP